MRACAFRLSLAYGISTPMRRICPDCCARKASGQATAEPPTSVMKSRRLIAFPEAKDKQSYRFTSAAMHKIAVKYQAPCPLWVKPRHCRVIGRHRRSARACPLRIRSRHRTALFDHLIGAGEQGLGHRQAQGLCRLQRKLTRCANTGSRLRFSNYLLLVA